MKIFRCFDFDKQLIREFSTRGSLNTFVHWKCCLGIHTICTLLFLLICQRFRRRRRLLFSYCVRALVFVRLCVYVCLFSSFQYSTPLAWMSTYTNVILIKEIRMYWIRPKFSLNFSCHLTHAHRHMSLKSNNWTNPDECFRTETIGVSLYQRNLHAFGERSIEWSQSAVF